MATIRLRVDRVYPSKKTAACDGGKNATPRTPFAAYGAISVRIMILAYILVTTAIKFKIAPGIYPRAVERLAGNMSICGNNIWRVQYAVPRTQ